MPKKKHVRAIYHIITRGNNREKYRKIEMKFWVCGSTIGQNICKAVEILQKDTEKKRYFDLILQN